MSEIIRSPWTEEQVINLNRYQWSGVFHEYTCGNYDFHLDSSPRLIATPLGWVCSDFMCPYTQNWAHAWPASGEFYESKEEGM